MERPKVGVGAIIVKDGKVLLGKRKDNYRDGSWCFPGGHLEFGEDVVKCAERETLEETGIKIKNIKLLPTFTNDIIKDEGLHYITLFAIAEHDSGEPSVMEPELFEKWDWFNWNELPRPLLISIENLLKQDYNPFL